jgi:hypothetical protein
MAFGWLDTPGAKLLCAALTAALVGGLVAGAYLGHQELAAEAGRLRAAPVVVAIQWPTAQPSSTPQSAPLDQATWLPPSQRQLLTELATNAISTDPLDPDSLPRAARALEASGWLRSVDSIKRHPGGTVTIRGTWRTYYAVVRIINADHLVSAEGELLPLIYPPGRTGLPVIFSPSQSPPQKPGAPWQGGDVQAGIRLLRVLAAHDKIMDQVLGIDVGRYARDRTLSIVTSSGALVVWGTAPGDFAPAEATQNQKIARLLELRSSRAHGQRIDAGRTRIDISSPRGILIDQSSSIATAPLGLGAAERYQPLALAERQAPQTSEPSTSTTSPGVE